MKKISMLALSAIFAAVLAGSSFAQAGAQPGVSKIGWIITGAFEDDKEGITRLINANKSLETELKPRATELQGMQTRLQAIADDIKKMQGNPAVPVNQTAVAAKQDEGEKLQRDFEYKQKDAQAAYAKRRQELVGPIFDQIGKALDDYAKQKGYTVIIDISALGQQNAPSPILLLDPSVNITKDFITYFNSRPATTATTAVPK
jgi:Skp family chaperone for outer membrane proteins